jgi:hypothetical protein
MFLRQLPIILVTACLCHGQIIDDDTTAVAPNPIIKPTTAPILKQTTIAAELKSAKDFSTGGAVLYGIGLSVEVVGAIVFINDATEWSSSSFYRSDTPPLEGYYVAIGGGAISFLGTILTNYGGSQARNICQIALGDAEEFKGWTYFGAGLTFTVTGAVLTMTEVPVIPTVLSLGGFLFNLASVVHSVGYTHRSYIRGIVASNLHFEPVLCLSGHPTNGMRLRLDF